MSDNSTTLKELRSRVAAFVEERQWSQFHSPKNLSMSIAIEAAELMELFQWTDGNVTADATMQRVQEELADVVIYCLSLANATGMDLSEAVKNKIKANASKYPVERFRGRYK